MGQIDYFFATYSPFTYLAGQRLEEIAARHGVSINYKPFDVVGVFARSGGTPLPQRPECRKEYRLQELQRQSRKHGLPINLQPAYFPPNGAPSAYAFIAAQKAGGGDLGKLAHSITRACWAEERDIADDAVIRDLLEQAGFDPGLADSGLLVGAETCAANLEEAGTRGVFGAPFYITDEDQRFWGQDRLEDLDLYLSGKI